MQCCRVTIPLLDGMKTWAPVAFPLACWTLGLNGAENSTP